MSSLAETLPGEAVADVMEALDSEDLAYRVPAARTAVELARALSQEHRDEAHKLLKKVLEATEEEAVLQEARLLVGEAGR